MPRKTKETENKKESLKDLLFPKKESKKADNKKEKKETTTKKAASSKKKATTEKKQNTVEVAKKTTTKKASSNVKEKPKKAVEKEVAKTTSKKKNSSTTTQKRKTQVTKSSTVSEIDKKKFSPEYYDLPYQYNKTVVKILAQTPTNLFVYWEISDEDRENLKNQYGQYFFEITKPVLIVHNETMGYSFEIDINDFANSWYIHVNDSDCEYKVELGRRPIPINYSYMPQYNLKKEGPIKPVEHSYIYISSSNNLDFPNDHILFNTSNKVYFRNVKTNKVIERDIKDFPFIIKDNHFIHIYELYEDLFKEEMSNNNFVLKNSSSGGNPSSGSLSSRFK